MISIFNITNDPQETKKPAPGTAAGVKLLFKHEKPVNHERPISPTLFKTLSEADPETKVLYRHTNFRRMPLTARQEKWLEDRENDRVKMSVEFGKFASCFVLTCTDHIYP